MKPKIEKYDRVKILLGDHVAREYIGYEAIVTQITKGGLYIVSVIGVEGTPSVRIAKKYLDLVEKYKEPAGFWRLNAS